jgi:quercetin dioxygenase-like cupin family protein
MRRAAGPAAMRPVRAERQDETMESPRDPGERPEPQCLADLVTVQKGTVISRQLIKKKTGSVTLFAFDGGEGLSEHTAPFDALVLAVEGEADIVIDQTPHRLQAGETITMPAGHPHAVRTSQPFKMLLVMIRE